MSKPKYNTASGNVDLTALDTDPVNPLGAVGKSYGELTRHGAADFVGGELGIGESKYDYGITSQMEGNLNEIRAQRQSGWDQAGNALGQALAEVVGGTIEGIGYLGDLSAFSNAVKTGEDYFGNEISRIGAGIKEHAREELPIYTNAEGFAPGDFSWWMTNAPSIASTLSLMIPSGAAVGVVRGATKALGLASKIPEGLAKGAGILGQAIISRHMESMMESSQLYDSVYQKNIANGMIEVDARKNAALAASTSYKANSVMLLQDVAQYAMLAGGFKGVLGNIDESAKLAKAMGKSTMPVYGKKGLEGLGNMISEGGEEAYQFIVGKESEFLAQKALEPDTNSTFSERMNEYIKDGELHTSAFFGAIGAGVMQGTMKGVNKFMVEGMGMPDLQVENIKGWGAETSRAMKSFLVAGELENAELYKGNKDVTLANMFVKAAQLNNMDRFNEFLDRMEKPTSEDLELFGITPEDAAQLSETAAEIRQDTGRFSEILQSNKKKLAKGEFKSPSLTNMATRNQYLLEKFIARSSDLESQKDDIFSKIPNYSKLSPEGQSIFNKKAESATLKSFNKSLEKEIKSNKDLSEDLLKSYNKVILKNVNTIKANDKTIAEAEETRTSEVKKEDNALNFKSKAVEEYGSLLSNTTSLDASISQLQESLDLIEKGELPYGFKPTTPTLEQLDVDEEIPEVDDIVIHTNEDTKEQRVAKVLNVENHSDYTVQLVGLQTGELDGDPIKVSVENLKRIVNSKDRDMNVEPTDDVVDNTKEDIENEEDDGVSFIESVSYIHIDYIKDKFGKTVKKERVVRSEKLNKILSNPLTNYDNANISMKIDKTYKDFWDKHQSLLDELNAGNLTVDRIKELPSAIKDNLPIKMTINIEGETVTGRFYLYTSDAKVIKRPANIKKGSDEHTTYIANQRAIAREFRTNVANKLLAGEKAVVTGLNTSKGKVNNTEKKQNLSKAMKQDYKNIRIAVGDKDQVLNEGNINYLGITVPRGGIYIITNKTCNNDTALVKVNPTKLSKQHAEILWEAYLQMYDRKGGYSINMEHPEVSGLSAGQTINLLAHNGLSQTSVEHAQGQFRLGEHMIPKQLFVKKDGNGKLILHFGNNTVPFLSNVDKAGMKKQFVEWAVANKNYPVKLTDERLGLTGLNVAYKKEFKLGTIEHNGTDSYSTMLMKNDMLSLNVEEFVDGSVFKEPVLKFDRKTLQVPKAAPKKEVTKPVDTKTKTVVAKAKNNVYSLEKASDMANLPEGSEVFTTKTVIEGTETITSNFKLGNIKVNSKGELVLVIKDSLHDKGYWQHIHNMKTSDPEMVNIILENSGISNVSEIKSSMQATEHQTNDVKPKTKTKVTPKVETLGDVILTGASDDQFDGLEDDEVETTTTTKDELEDVEMVDDLDELSLDDDESIFRLKPNKKTYKVQNVKKERRRIANMLGKRYENTIQETDKLIDILETGQLAFANYKHDGILLYNQSETGTLYHEAFHRVSLAYLTPDEREHVYEAARRKYSLRSISDKEVEEFLAEKYRDYTLARREGMSVVGKALDVIKTFFNRLYNSIYNYFAGPKRLTEYEISDLFSSIYYGKYKSSKLLEENKDNLVHSYNRKLYNTDFSSIDNMDTLRSVIKGLTHKLLITNKISDFDNISNINFEPLVIQIEKLNLQLKKYLTKPDLTEDQKNTAQARLNLYTDILGFNDVTGKYESFEVIKDLIFNFMDSMDLTLKESKRKSPDEFTDEEGDALGISGFDKSSYEVSPKENAQANVKVAIALLPVMQLAEQADGSIGYERVKNPTTNMNEFVDYNETWNTLLAQLYDINDAQSMIKRLESLIPTHPHYSELVNLLTRDKDNIFQNQFEATMRKHKNNFMNAMVEIGDDSLSFKFPDADVRNVVNNSIKEWNMSFRMTDNVVKEKDKVPELDQDFVKDLREKYDAIRSKVTKAYNTPTFLSNIPGYYDSIISLLASVNIIIDERTLDYIVDNAIGDPAVAFGNFVLRDMNSMVTNVFERFNPGEENSSKMFNHSSIRKIATFYAKAHPEEISNMILGPNSAQYYTFSNHSNVTSFVRDMKLNPDLATELLNKRGNESSIFLKQIATDPEIRRNLAVMTFSGVFLANQSDQGRDYFDITALEDYLVKLHANYKDLVSFPTLADKKTYYFLKGLKPLAVNLEHTKDDTVVLAQSTIDEFYRNVQSEYDRITKAREELALLKTYRKAKKTAEADAIENNMVENYHYTVKNGVKDFTKGNAYNFVSFKGLDYDNYSEEISKEAVEQSITALVKLELDHMNSLGIVSTDVNGEYTSDKIDNKVLGDLEKEFGSVHNAIIALATKHVVRNIDNSLELHKMFIGDPAFYKADREGNVDTDLGKRLGSLIASGEEMSRNSNKYLGDEYEANYNVSTIRTQKLQSAYYNDMLDKYTEVLGSKEKAKAVLKPYLELEQADGQSFITPNLYRAISIKIGEWNSNKEEAFKLLTSGKDLTLEDEVKARNVILNPLKTVYFGFDFHKDVAIPIYDKMSMAPLFRMSIKGNQELEDILDRMEAKGKYSDQAPIDMLKMDSATKTGNRGAVPLFSDSSQTKLTDLKTLNVNSQQFKNLRRQVATPTHTSENSTVGTQFIKIAMSNLDLENAVYNTKSGKKTGKQMASIINKSLGALSKHGKEAMDVEFGVKNGKVDKEKLSESLFKESKKAGMPMSVTETLKTVDGDFFLSPDSYPNRNWYQSRIITKATKKIVDREMPGGQYIQVSNLGYRHIKDNYNLEERAKDDNGNVKDEDRITWLREGTTDLKFVDVTGDGDLNAMECVVSITLFKHIIPNYNNLTHQERADYIVRHKLDVIGYRIPTQGQSSTVPMRVAGVLPEQAGDSIILPSEFSGLTGSDFDIDKLFMVRKNYETFKGDLKEIEFITSDDKRAYNKMVYYKFLQHKQNLSDDFKVWYYGTDMNYIETSDKILTDNPIADAKLETLIEIINIAKANLKNAKSKNAQIKYILQLDDAFDRLYDVREEFGQSEQLDRTKLSRKDGKTLTDRITEELVKLDIMPKFEDFKKLDDYSKNIPKAIENRLINAYNSILLSRSNMLDTTSPLGGITDLLKEKAVKKRKQENTSSPNMMSMFTPRHQSILKSKYSSGKGGVSPFALHNSHHVLTQIVDYAIAGGVSELQNTTIKKSKLDNESDVNLVSLAGEVGYDGIKILDWLSALIDAHVDLAKDPYVMDLNVNDFTYDATTYLIRSGVGGRTFDYLSMPGLKLAASTYANNKASVFKYKAFSPVRAIDETIDLYLQWSGEESLEDIVEELSDIRRELLIEGTNSIELKYSTDVAVTKNRSYYLEQIAALQLLKSIKAEASLLNADVKSTQIDARKYGTNLMEIESFMGKIRKSYENSILGKTYGYEKMVPYDPITKFSKKTSGEVFTADYYRNGLVYMQDLFSGITVYSQPQFKKSLYTLLKLTGRENTTNTKDVTSMANELYSSLVGNYFFSDKELGFGVSAVNLKLLLTGKKSVFALFDELKAKEEHAQFFETNSLLNRLTTSHDETSDLPNYFIFKNSSFKDSMEKDDISYSWEDLMTHSDPDMQKLGRYLFIYAYYTTGFNNKLYGFNNVIAPSIMKSIHYNDKTVSLDAAMKALLGKFNSTDMSQELATIMDDVLSHRHVGRNVGKSVKWVKTNLKDYDVFTPLKNPEALLIGSTTDGKQIYTPYIKTPKSTFKYVGYMETGSETVPIYTKQNQRGHSAQARFMVEYGLKGLVLQANENESSIPVITNEIKAGLAKQYGGTFVEVSKEDIYGSNSTKINPTPTPLKEEKFDTSEMRLSTKDQPIEIFVDGSLKPKSNFQGYGAYASYNGKSYGISGTDKDITGYYEKFKDSKRSSGEAEMMGLAATLKHFKDTDEHIKIYQDSELVINWGKLWDHSEDSPYGRKEKAYNVKKENIKFLYDNIMEHIDSIEKNGGSVSLVWVKAHTGNETEALYPKLYTDSATTNKLKTGNDRADISAQSVTSKDTFPGLLGLRRVLTPIKESSTLKKLESVGNGLEYTPDNITSLKPNEVFVFGSNEGSSIGGKPTHGKGAALIAKQKFGAIQGQSRGLQGQSYALVTKKHWDVMKSSTLEEIQSEFVTFNKFAKENPNKKFYVTKVGSSLGGYSISEIANSIKTALGTDIASNVVLPKEYEYRTKSSQPVQTVQGDISTFTNHSGGALGADSMWDTLGKSYGMVNNKHYYFGKKTPKGNVDLGNIKDDRGRFAAIIEGNKAAKIANTTLKRGNFDNYRAIVKNLISRNWYQVKNADTIFAISKGFETLGGDKIGVLGGTGWAVQMAIDNNKPVYVFDQSKNSWYSLGNGTLDEFKKLDIAPTLTKNFAGIGTRDITEAGIQAIHAVYRQTTKEESVNRLELMKGSPKDIVANLIKTKEVLLLDEEKGESIEYSHYQKETEEKYVTRYNFEDATEMDVEIVEKGHTFKYDNFGNTSEISVDQAERIIKEHLDGEEIKNHCKK